MFKVYYHYEINGEAKQFLDKVFMTLEEAREYILDNFDNILERTAEYDETSRLPEGRHAEILREVIEDKYSIEYVAAV